MTLDISILNVLKDNKHFSKYYLNYPIPIKICGVTGNNCHSLENIFIRYESIVGI